MAMSSFWTSGAALSETIFFKEDEDGRIRFLGDTQEKTAWYESGYANIAFYLHLCRLFLPERGGLAHWRSYTHLTG
jgi:hypothetical protein